MPILSVRSFSAAFAAALAVGVLAPVAANATGPTTCFGGPIASDTYDSLTIAGPCYLVAGNVNVTGDVTVLPGATLAGVWAGSDLTVGGNVFVQSGASLVLGCEPFAFTCFNDPGDNSTMTNDTIGGRLSASDALAVLVHHTTIQQGVSDLGGGGGIECFQISVPGLGGFPVFSDFEDNSISGGATISGLSTCWLGFIRNSVNGAVKYTNNALADPDANEVVTNRINGSLSCSGNSPAAQIGDSGGKPNVVTGKARGECAALV